MVRLAYDLTTESFFCLHLSFLLTPTLISLPLETLQFAFLFTYNIHTGKYIHNKYSLMGFANRTHSCIQHSTQEKNPMGTLEAHLGSHYPDF